MFYFAEDELDASFIEAAAAQGAIVPWRISADGRQWFKALPTIYGGPTAEPAEIDADEELDADLAEIELDEEGDNLEYLD